MNEDVTGKGVHPSVLRLAKKLAAATESDRIKELIADLRSRPLRPSGESIAIPADGVFPMDYFNGYNDAIKWVADYIEQQYVLPTTSPII